jgi:two-component system cell cycle sensor histidine kinase/response regulator CckA
MQREPSKPTSDPVSSNDVAPIIGSNDSLGSAPKHVERHLGYYQMLFDHAPIAYIIADPNGVIIEANYAMAEQLGYERAELINSKLTELVDCEQRLVLAQYLMSVMYHNKAGQYDIQLRQANHNFLPVNLQIVPHHYEKQRYLLITCTEHGSIHQSYNDHIQQLQQQHERERLQSMDILAGGIAHDLNNLLQVVAGNIELANESLTRNKAQSLEQNLHIAVQTVQDAIGLIKQMLLFSGRGRLSFQAIELNQFIHENLQFLRSKLPDHILFELEPHNQPISILASPQHLRQMLLNLVLNACDAIGANAGIITVTLGSAYLDQEIIQRYRISDTASAGWFGYIQISDTGNGMDEHTMSRMFDPYFSTKETGNGLGLPMVRAITRFHHGVLQVSSRQSLGTTITFAIPQTINSA